MTKTQGLPYYMNRPGRQNPKSIANSVQNRLINQRDKPISLAPPPWENTNNSETRNTPVTGKSEKRKSEK